MLGLILGFSYLFRFQIAFAIFGFIIWLLLIHKSGLVYVLKMGLSFFAVILFGFLVDSWFYGEWVFTTWNYFYTFFQGEGADFGASPWYFYLEKLYDFPGYFLGILLMSAFIFILLFKPKNIYLWCLLPFILAHSFITHKEERFFFPMVFLFPILLMESWVILKKLIKVRLYVKILNVMLALIFLVVNGTGLIAMGQKSAGIGRMEITRYIHENYGNKSINLIYCSWANPYNPWHELPMKFYLEKSMSERRINNLGELNDSLIVHEKDVVNLLVLRKADLSYEKGIERIKNCDFSFEIQSIPKWIECINAKYKGFDNCDILELYRYTKKI